MSVDALVWQVGEVLGRAHSLFGQPPASGGAAAINAGSDLATAADLVRTQHRRMSTQTGALPANYTVFATDAGPALDAAADADNRLGSNLQAAASTDRTGHANSGAVVNGAAADTTALAPSSGTAAGQRAIISALRARLAQQQQVISAYQARDARLAAMVQSLTYARKASGGAMPMRSMPFGGGGSPSPGLSGLSSLGSLTGGRNPWTGQASNIGWFNRSGNVPSGPGLGASQAALSKLGRPYVWGAKGPSYFDCSGLTQWAWREAGVTIGGDTYSQIKDGIPVPPGQVRAGDLIFPLDSFGASGPSHVQLAISDHQVVHAPTTGDVVKIAPLPGRYLARRPVRTMGG